MKQQSPTFEDAALHLAMLSTAHTEYNKPNPEDLDPGEEMPEPLPEGTSVDTGYYKEADTAIWAMTRITDRDNSVTIAGRVRRMDIAASGVNGEIPVDVFCLAADSQNKIEIARIGQVAVRQNFLMFFGGEYALPSQVIQDILPESKKTNEVEFQATMDPHDTINSVADQMSREMLTGLLRLDINDRYVGRSMSERDVLAGRERAQKLYNSIHNLFVSIQGGRHFGGKNIGRKVEVSQGEMESAWMIISPEGKAISLFRSRIKELSIAEEVDSDMAALVRPPSILARDDKTSNLYNYTASIMDPATKLTELFSIDGRTLVASKSYLNSPEEYDLQEPASAKGLEAAAANLGNIMKIRHVNMANGIRYLDNTETDDLIDLLEDSGALSRYLQLFGTYQETAKQLIDNEAFQRIVQMPTKYPHMVPKMREIVEA